MDILPMSPTANWKVGASQARFFGLSPASLMSLKLRRRLRKRTTRVEREARALYRFNRGRHDRWIWEAGQ